MKRESDMKMINFSERIRERKQKARERYSYYENRMQPVKAAKKECISFFARLGKKYSIMKWPIFIALVAFIFVYNVFYHILLNLQVKDKFARGLAAFMALVLIVTSVDLTAWALQEGFSDGEYYEVVGIEGEFEDISVPFGTALSDIDFPKTIKVTANRYEKTVISEQDTTEVTDDETADDEAAEASQEAVVTEEITLPQQVLYAQNPVAEEPVIIENPEVAGAEEEIPQSIEEEPQQEPEEEPQEEQQEEQSNESTEQVTEETVPQEQINEEEGNEEYSEEQPEEETEGDIGEAAEETETVEPTEDTDVTKPVNEEAYTTTLVEEAVILELAATWNCDEYDSSVAGEYIFTAVLPETYDSKMIYYGENAIPSIRVIVGEPSAVKLETVVDGIEITMEAKPGVFDPDVTLSATRIIDKNIEKLVSDEIESRNNEESETMLMDYMAFDIVVLDKDSNEVQPRKLEGIDPSEAVTVTFKKIGDKIKDDEVEEDEQNLEVYYVDDNLKNIENVTSSEDGDDVTFNPEHFSIYVCACEHTSYMTVSTWAELCKKVLGKSGEINVKFGDDITQTTLSGYSTENGLYIDSGAKVNLNMNGYSLRGREGIGQVILVANGGTLEIHNSTGVGAEIAAVGNDAAIRITGSGSVVDVWGATIKNDRASGSVIKAESGAVVNLNGGELAGAGVGLSLSDSSAKLNEASIVGGKRGIYLSNGSVTVENGSSIKDYSECGIYMNNPSSGVVNIVSAELMGNSAYKTVGINCIAGASFNLGSDVKVSNNTDIKISGLDNSAGVVAKANTLINLLASPANVLSIAIDDMSLESGAVQFTVNYVSGAEGKFKSAVSTSYDIWKPATDNYLLIGAKDDCTIMAQAQNIFQQKATAGNDAIAGIVQIGSGEITDQSIVATAATATSNTGKTVSTRVKFGAQVTLKSTLINAEKYDFKGWKNIKGTIVSTDSTYVFNASENDMFTAVYEKKKGTVTVAANDTKLGSVKGGGTYEYDQVATLVATAANGKEWKQWNDGPIYDKRDKDGSLDRVTRNVTVAGNVTYTALFGEPDPDKTLTGTLYANVDQMTASNPGVGNYILFLPSNVEVEKVGSEIALGNLPEGAAILRVLSDSEYGSASVKKENVKNYTRNSNGYVAKGNGVYVAVEVADSKFDSCRKGYIEYNSSSGYWYYWCYATGVQGVHDYNVYRYQEKTSFKAGDISVTKIDDFIPNATTREEIEKSTINIRIKTQNGNNYELAGISFLKNAIDYNVGDKTVVFKVGDKVTYTYYFPEAMIGNVEYKTLQEAVDAANAKTAGGGTAEIKVVGPGVSQIDTPENINVNGGVIFKNYDGSSIEAQEGGVKASVDSKGVVTIVNGTATATPKNNSDITVGVGDDGAMVTTNTQLTIIASEDAQGNVQREVVPANDVNEIVISPDGNPKHTVTYYNCEQDKGYGINSGVLTEEDKVEITDGTEYDLQVELNGSQTVVETNASNSGKTTITKGNSQEEGGDYLTVVSEAAHDDIVINTDGKNEATYTTNTANTVIKVAPGKDKTPEGDVINEVILDEGSVDVSKFGEVTTKDGTVYKNLSETGEVITVTADEQGGDTGEISIPSGGSAEIIPKGSDEPVYVSVPPAKGGDAQNSPVVVKPTSEGGVVIEADAGNPVIIGKGDDAIEYTTGEFETVLEIKPNENGEPEVVVADGSVILKPGQSIKDANGVVFTNPPTPEGEDPKQITLSITEGEPTGVKTVDGGTFEYQLPGEKVQKFENPSSGDASFNVSKDGEIKLDSKVDLKGDSGKGISISTGEGDTEVKPVAGNTGTISVDTEEKTVTVKENGDTVSIGGQEYKVTDDNTVIKVGDNGPELLSGGIELDGDSSIVVGNTEVKADEEGGLSIEKNAEGGLDIKVPQGGTFIVETPGNTSTDIVFSNPTQEEIVYEIAPTGGIILPAGTETVCKHADEEITVKSEQEGTVITPSTEGVTVTTPKDTTVEINGQTYTNESDEKQLELSVEGDEVILKRGNVSVEEGGDITLYNGDRVSVNEGEASVDENGNIEVKKDTQITISDDGEDTVIKAVEEDTRVEIDPESGTTVLKSGAVELSNGSGLNVVYDRTPVYDGEDIVDYVDSIMNIESISGEPTTVTSDGDVIVPKGSSIRVESSTDDGKTATNVVKVSPKSSGDVEISVNTDGTVNAELDKDSTVSVNGNEYTAKTDDTEINVGAKGATLENGKVALDPGEAINAGGSNVKNSGAKGSEVIISSDNSRNETYINAPKGGKFTLSEEGKENGYTFTNPSAEPADYTVNKDGNLVLEDGDPILVKIGGKDVTVSGSDENDVEIRVTADGINMSTEEGQGITVGKNTIINNTPDGGEKSFNAVVDSTGDIILKEGEAVVPKGSVVNVESDDGNKAKIENNSNNDDNSEISISDDGTVELKHIPSQEDDNPKETSVVITSENGKKNTYIATDDKPVVLDTTPESGSTPVLESGSVALGGGKNKSSVVVNGLSVTNEGSSDGVTVTKEGTGESAVTELEVAPGSTFGLSAPGEEDNTYKFSAPADATEPSTFSVDNEGNIEIEENSSIEFADGKGNKSQVKVEGTNTAKLTVDEDGVKVITQPGKVVEVNGTKYKNHDGQEELILSVDDKKETVLESGTTGLLPGESISIVSEDPQNPGETIKTRVEVPDDASSTGSRAALISDDGTITSSTERTFVLTDEKGNKNEIKATGSEAEPTKLEITSDGVELKEGSAQVPSGSEIIVNGSIIKNTGDPDSTVDVKGNDDGTIDFELSEGASFAMGDPKTGETVEFKNPEGTSKSEFTLDEDGNLTLGKNSAICYEVNGQTVNVANTSDKPAGIKVTEDGVTFDIPAGGSVKVGDNEFKNTGNEPMTLAVNKDGKPVLVSGELEPQSGQEILIKEDDGTYTPVKVTETPASGEKIKISGDGTVSAPEGTKISVDGNDYSVTDTEGAVIKTDSEEGMPVLQKGAVDVANGDSIAVSIGEGNDAATQVVTNKGNTNPEQAANPISVNSKGEVEVSDGTKLEVTSKSADNEDEGVKVSSPSGSEIEINGGTYENKDSAGGTFAVEVNGNTGEVTLTEGKNVDVSNGNITVGDTTISTTSDKPVSVTDKGTDKKGNPLKPDIVAKTGGNVTIGSTKTDGSVEVKIPQDTTNPSETRKISIDSAGNISVPVAEDEKITIGGITYTAGDDGKIVVDGKSGALDSNKTNSNPSTAVDPKSFNQSSYTYKVPAGTSVDVGGVKYIAPKEGMTLIGNENGNPIVKVTNQGSSVTIGDRQITAGSKNTEFYVDDNGEIHLVDNGSDSANSSIRVTGDTPVSVDGNTYTGSDKGGYTVSLSDDGDVVNIKDGSSVTVDVGKDSKVVLADVKGDNGEPIELVSKATQRTPIVIDRTKMDNKGDYTPNIKGGKNTKIKPIYDADGNLTGYEAVYKSAPKNNNPFIDLLPEDNGGADDGAAPQQQQPVQNPVAGLIASIGTINRAMARNAADNDDEAAAEAEEVIEDTDDTDNEATEDESISEDSDASDDSEDITDLGEEITDNSGEEIEKAVEEKQEECSMHWGLLGLTAIYLIALVLLRNKNNLAKLGLLGINIAAAIIVTLFGECSNDKLFLIGNLMTALPSLNIIKSKDGIGVIAITKSIVEKLLYAVAAVGIVILVIASILSLV